MVGLALSEIGKVRRSSLVEEVLYDSLSMATVPMTTLQNGRLVGWR